MYHGLTPYERYLRAEWIARANGELERELRFARMKARAYRMYGVNTLYF